MPKFRVPLRLSRQRLLIGAIAAIVFIFAVAAISLRLEFQEQRMNFFEQAGRLAALTASRLSVSVIHSSASFSDSWVARVDPGVPDGDHNPHRLGKIGSLEKEATGRDLMPLMPITGDRIALIRLDALAQEAAPRSRLLLVDDGGKILWGGREEFGTGFRGRLPKEDGLVASLQPGTGNKFFLWAGRQVPGFPLWIFMVADETDVLSDGENMAAVRFGLALLGGLLIAGLTWLLIEQLRGLEVDDERKQRFESHRRLRGKMESVGRFAGGVAHDFNNVLTVMFGHVDRLQRLEPTPDEATRRTVESLYVTALRARDLVRRILTLARPAIEAKELDVGTFLEESVLIIQPSLSGNIEITTEFESGLRVRADPVTLSRIVMSLTTNAIEAMPTGGRLSLRADRPAEIPGFVRISVIDQGTGLEGSQLSRAFEPFYTTKGSGAAGLGLPTARLLAESAGASLRLTSQGRGAGVTAEILWPEAPERREVSRDSIKSPTPGAILFVDDDEAVLESAEETLRRHGLTATFYADGPSALRDLEKNRDRYTLLITDVNMNPMDGFELARRACVLKPSLSVIFASAHPDSLSQAANEAAVRERGGEVLGKPYRPEELVAAIARMLREPLSGSEPRSPQS